MYNQISLRIHSVKCVDETNGQYVERLGNDEIYLAGFGIDANANPSYVRPFEVYANFDTGDVKTYSPPKAFVTLDLTGSRPFPKKCSVGFLLAERDGGDFGDKATKVYNKLVEELDKRKTEEVQRRRISANEDPLRSSVSALPSTTLAIDPSSTGGTSSGGGIPLGSDDSSSLGGDILVAIVAAAIIAAGGFVIKKIITTSSDDIFPLRTTNVTINSADFKWDGSKVSPPSTVEFRGQDGVYLLTYDWELS